MAGTGGRPGKDRREPKGGRSDGKHHADHRDDGLFGGSRLYIFLFVSEIVRVDAVSNQVVASFEFPGPDGIAKLGDTKLTQTGVRAYAADRRAQGVAASTMFETQPWPAG